LNPPGSEMGGMDQMSVLYRGYCARGVWHDEVRIRAGKAKYPRRKKKKKEINGGQATQNSITNAVSQ
jgi:hypothetical protein